MSRKLYNIKLYNIDKTTWEKGPWTEEPDYEQWVEFDLDCLIVRNPSGHLCGYVGVAEGHPWFGIEYNKYDAHCHVHGGLTYSDFCTGRICHEPFEGRPHTIWWLGFDCNHLGDRSPTYSFSLHDQYRDIDYVKKECARLARQLNRVGISQDTCL